MKHSPAPWRTTFNSAKERGVRNENGFICFLTKPHHFTGQDERYNKELRENEVNAALIAAAPDMFNLLKDIAYPEPGSKAEYWTIRSFERKAQEIIAKIQSNIAD